MIKQTLSSPKILRSGIVVAIVLCALVPTACENAASSTNALAVASPAATEPVVRLNSAVFDGLPFTFRSTRGLGRLDVTAKYTISGNGTAAQANAVTRALAIQPPEFTWVGLYVQNAVLRFVNEGIRTPGLELTLKPDDGSVRRNGPWWLENSHGALYGVHTLAGKQGTEVLQITDADPKTETDWEPLTPETYSRWWSQVDQRLGLDALFGNR